MADVERILEEVSLSLDHERRLSDQDFMHLYDANFSQVYNYICYRCSDLETADELTAHTFEQAFLKLGSYSPEKGPFSPWLFGIARNTVNAHLRATRRRKWFSLDAIAQLAAKNTSPEESVIAAETEQNLLAALRSLPERERDLLSLKFAGRLTNRRIAEISGLSESHVGVLIHRAVQKLRRRLRTAGDESIEDYG